MILSDVKGDISVQISMYSRKPKLNKWDKVNIDPSIEWKAMVCQ